MVGIKKLFILLILSSLPLFADAQSGGFVERQLSQLTIRSEKTSEALSLVRHQYSLNPSDSLSMVIHELEKQSAAIEKAIEKLSEQQNMVLAPMPETLPELPVEQSSAITTTTEATPDVTTDSKEEEVATADLANPTIEEVAENAEVAEDVVTPEEYEEVVTQTEQEDIAGEEEAEQSEEQPSADNAPGQPSTDNIPEEPSADNAPEETLVQTTQEKPDISEELKALFSTSLRRYALIANEIDGLFAEYEKAYKSTLVSIEEYGNATSLATLNKHYSDYQTSIERTKKIADTIANRSDILFTSKNRSLQMFADTLMLDSLSARYLAMVEQTESSMGEKLVGKCTDLDLAMYPHRLRNTLYFEADLARYFAPESADSIRLAADNFDTTYTLFAPHNTPKRSDAKFAAVKIQKSAKERAVSSLPTIKIPSEGELYSIMVGNYASLPPSTKVFRGATPLYRERREDGRTYIYIGLYPTAQSAQDDIALLRKTGFKQPTLVMWRDGIRRDDFVDRVSKATTPKATMWRIEIGGASTVLPSDVLSIVREKAPRKEISKFNSSEGETLYTIGIFTKQDEAQTLATALQKAPSALSVRVVQVGKK